MSLSGASFSYTFPAYSMTVIDLVPGTAHTGSISGSVKTANGMGVPNMTIYLDANNNGQLDAGELSTTTDSSGDYSFGNVSPEALIVRQILPTGDAQTNPADGYGIHVAVTAGACNERTRNFTDTLNPKTGSVSGVVSTSNGYRNSQRHDLS